MNEFHVRLNILIEILLKKKEALTIILNICENEETILESGSGEHTELLAAMLEEKQKAIAAVLESDELFQSSYDAIRSEFELKAPLHRGDAGRLQELIGFVCEQDMKIRIQEEKNKRLGNKRNKPVVLPRNAAKVAESYIQNVKAAERGKK